MCPAGAIMNGANDRLVTVWVPSVAVIRRSPVVPAVAAAGVQANEPAPSRSRARREAIYDQVAPLSSDTSSDAVQAGGVGELMRVISMPESITSPIFDRRSSVIPEPPLAVAAKV